MFVRSSRLPLSMACPASLQAPGYLVNEDSIPARLGTAAHEGLGEQLQGKAVDEEQLELLAVKYTVPLDELRMLFYQAYKLLHEGNIMKYFPQREVEVEVSSLALHPVEQKGHVDLRYYSEQSKTIYILDHKTGWLDSDCTHQIKSYGFQSLEDYPEADRVHTMVARTRDFVIDHETYTKDELVAWGSVVKKRLVEERDQYFAGKHCTYCPHRLNCIAYEDWVRRSIQLILSWDSSKPFHITPEVIGNLYAAKSNLKKVIADVEDVLKTMANNVKGSLDCGDAYELRLESQITTEILFEQAWPMLSELVDRAEWNEAFKVRKTALEKIIKADAAKGQKSKHWMDLLDKLEGIEALNKTEETKFVHRKKSIPVME